jgi:predicted SnoaL-like aldol condensation-catalyzing enzyme
MKKGVRCCLAALVFTLSCNRGHDSNTNPNNVAIVKSFSGCFNRHDWAKVAGFYADSSLFLDPCYGRDFVLKTRQNVVDRYWGMQKEMPDIRDSVLNAFADGDKIAIEFIITGSLPDGTKIRIPTCDIWEMKSGLIIKDACYYDNK